MLLLCRSLQPAHAIVCSHTLSGAVVVIVEATGWESLLLLFVVVSVVYSCVCLRRCCWFRTGRWRRENVKIDLFIIARSRINRRTSWCRRLAALQPRTMARSTRTPRISALWSHRTAALLAVVLVASCGCTVAVVKKAAMPDAYMLLRGEAPTSGGARRMMSKWDMGGDSHLAEGVAATTWSVLRLTADKQV